MLAENGITTMKVLWKIIFKEHEVVYNHLFNMTLQSHSQAMCYLTQPITFFFHFPIVVLHFLCPYHVTLNLILENSILDSCAFAHTQKLLIQLHLCLCIFMVREQHVTALSLLIRQSWFWISHCETVLKGFNSRRRFWHTYLVERIHVHPRAHSYKNKYTATLDEKAGAGC